MFTMTGSSTRTSSGRQSVSRDLRSRPGTTTGALLEDVKEEEASRDDERTVEQAHEVVQKEKGNAGEVRTASNGGLADSVV